MLEFRPILLDHPTYEVCFNVHIGKIQSLTWWLLSFLEHLNKDGQNSHASKLSGSDKMNLLSYFIIAVMMTLRGNDVKASRFLENSQNQTPLNDMVTKHQQKACNN